VATDLLGAIVKFNESVVEAARSRYSDARTNPWPSIHLPENLAAFELMDSGVLGALEITKGADTLFPFDSGTYGLDLNVLRVLLGLRQAVSRAAAGMRQEVAFGQEWRILRVERSDREICAATRPQNRICASEREWERVLDAALQTTREWLVQKFPELAFDPLFGPWITGSPPPPLTGLCEPAP
jgi:hypothetical protein